MTIQKENSMGNPISEKVELSTIHKTFAYMHSERFVIPSYQRPFSWGKKQIDDLIDDIHSALQKNDDTYSFGTILLAKGKDTSEKRKDVFYVIDGQQRLTTFMMLISAISQWTDSEIFSKNLIAALEAKDYYGNYISSVMIKEDGTNVILDQELVEYIKTRLVGFGLNEKEVSDFILDKLNFSLNILIFRDSETEKEIFKYCLNRFINMNSKGLRLIEEEVQTAKDILQSML